MKRKTLIKAVASIWPAAVAGILLAEQQAPLSPPGFIGPGDEWLPLPPIVLPPSEPESQPKSFGPQSVLIGPAGELIHTASSPVPSSEEQPTALPYYGSLPDRPAPEARPLPASESPHAYFDNPLTAKLLAEPIISADVHTHTFSVTYESLHALTPARIAAVPVKVGRAWTYLNYGDSPPPLPELQGIAFENEEKRAVATYQIVRPDDGWRQLGEDTVRVEIILSNPLNDAIPDPTSIVRSITQSVPPPIAGLEKTVHDWTKDLEDALGLDPGETPDPSADSDNDGVEDITEFFLGSDPFSGADGVPVDVRVMNLQGRWHFTVTTNRRTNAFGIEAGVQGSADGTDWVPADDLFEVHQSEYRSPHMEQIVLRTIDPISSLELKFFRISTTLID